MHDGPDARYWTEKDDMSCMINSQKRLACPNSANSMFGDGSWDTDRRPSRQATAQPRGREAEFCELAAPPKMQGCRRSIGRGRA